jgi:hypothetical protein
LTLTLTLTLTLVEALATIDTPALMLLFTFMPHSP